MRPSRDSKVIVSSIIYYRYSPSHQQRRAPRRLAGSRSTAGTARGEGGGAAAEGGGRRLAEPGRRLTSRLLPARTANRGSFPFVSWPRRQGGPRLAHRRLCPRTAPPPFPEPLCEAAAETAAVAARLHRWCPRWARGIKLKLRRASLRWWAGEFGGRWGPRGPSAGAPRLLGSDQQQVRRRGTREPGGQGMHVPSVAAAGERRAGRALRFLQTPREAPENKSFAGAWAESGVRGARRRSTIRAEPQAAAWLSLPLPSTSLLGSAPLGSARALAPLAADRARPAPRTRPAPSLPGSWDSRPEVLAPSCQRLRQLRHRWRAGALAARGGFRRTEGGEKGRVRSLGPVAGLSSLVRTPRTK